MAASELLWELSGFRYGSCPVTFRPCRRDCAPAGATWASWWDGASWPYGTPSPGSSLWWNAMCGSCAGDCACSSADTLLLPELVQSVTEVMIDGAVLPPSGYALYSGWKLTRTDGERWPLCQDWSVPVSGVGAWSVTAVVGEPVPMAGRFALAQLATEYARFCTSGVCQMPAYTTQKSRQGVTQTFPSAAELRQLGLTGWAMVDAFLMLNPAGLRVGPAIWNPDDIGSGYRTAGGV